MGAPGGSHQEWFLGEEEMVREREGMRGMSVGSTEMWAEREGRPQWSFFYKDKDGTEGLVLEGRREW